MSQEAEPSSKAAEVSPKNTSIPHAPEGRPPLVRSMTLRDDSWHEAPMRSPSIVHERTIDEMSKAESEEPDKPPAAPESTVPPLNATQAVFFRRTGQLSVPPSVDNRISRTRTNLPVPVPNLIKKSRGRRVPIVGTAA